MSDDTLTDKKASAAAAAIGRLGGHARAEQLSKRELSRIGQLGGRPQKYRVRYGQLERRDSLNRWHRVPKPYSSVQREAFRRALARRAADE